jgi:poly(3-hydroxyoctanoate) depolymerase
MKPDTDAPASHQMLTIGDLRVHLRRSGHGRPVLFIGGLGNDVEVWSALTSAIPDVEAIVVDAPGMGRSSLPQLPLSMSELAAVYSKVIEALGLGEVCVVGFSFGGAVAQQLARQSPELVKRLVLCATGPGLGGTPGAPLALQELATPLRYYSEARLRRVTPSLYGGKRACEPERFLEEMRRRVASPPSITGYYFQLTALAGWSSLNWLGALTMPVLIVAGDSDPVFPVANAKLMERLIPNAHVEIMKGSGHLLIIDSVEELAGLLRAFLSPCDDRASNPADG